ncbi:MAG: glycosyltransferase family 4 protein, partial [Gluconacetobacter diazotrophicus]|nr:glycosyltransferase family 4 protein [Gluconacetobacter diazotrophicus]
RWPEVGTRAWDAIEAIAARLDPARDRPFRPEPRVTLAVVLAARAMDDRTAAIVCGLARHYAVELVSEHRVGGEHWATAAFPLHSPARLAEAEHGRLLVLLGDDGDEAVAACRLLDSYPGILVATGRPVAVLLRETAERSGPAGRDAAAVLLELRLGAGGWHAVAAGNRPDDDAVEAALERRLVASWRLDALPADGAGWGAPIEAAYRDGPLPNQEVMLRRIAAGPMRNAPDHELLDVARPASLALRREHGAPRRDDPALFLDVSTQAQYDAGTGIQRVVREVVRQLAENGLPGRRVEPVIAVAGRFDLARRFGMRMFGLPVRDGVPEHADREVPVRPGDVYVALDLCLHDIAGLRDTLRRVRAEGGRSFVVVYDLLPVLQPDAFPFPVREAFPRWLEAIARDADGLVCISRAVADELLDWLREHGPRRRTALRIGWFHLGADFLPLAAAGGEDDVAGLDPARPSFLMVGTIEPRKGHGQVLSGFDALWERGVDAALVVVGKAGWMTGELVDRLREHPERGRRLFWIENGSDALVSRLYRSASALLMASRGEGFGLPVVEAARAGLPVISRRLPVCVEVAGEGATWFDGEEPGAVAAAVEGWLAARAAGRVPDPKLVRTLSWAEAGRDFARAVVDGNRYAEWGGPES